MTADGADRHVQRVRNLTRAAALEHELHDLPLAMSDVDRSRRCVHPMTAPVSYLGDERSHHVARDRYARDLDRLDRPHDRVDAGVGATEPGDATSQGGEELIRVVDVRQDDRSHLRPTTNEVDRDSQPSRDAVVDDDDSRLRVVASAGELVDGVDDLHPEPDLGKGQRQFACQSRVGDADQNGPRRIARYATPVSAHGTNNNDWREARRYETSSSDASDTTMAMRMSWGSTGSSSTIWGLNATPIVTQSGRTVRRKRSYQPPP